MKALHIGISTVVLFSLAGCGSTGLGDKRIDYRSGAVQAPSLEIPPGLTSPESDDRYKVPQGEGVATYSDYSKGGESSQVRGAAAVLPEVKGVRLERNGAQRWLVVSDKPENVWPVVKAFWQEAGLSIASEDQAAGVMETDWAENRAKLPLSGIRSIVGKVFDNLYSSGEKDQYRTRLERGTDGSTSVYITHRGMEEVVSADGNTSKWLPRANDPEIEAVLLQKLMVRFGGSESQAASAVSAGAAASAATAGGDGKASLQEVFDGSEIMVVNDAFDKTWRRVGLAIERAGLAVEDKDRAKGIYFLGRPKAERGWMDTLKFWQDDEDTNRRYRVNVKDGGTSSEVTVTDQDGISDGGTSQVLESIYKNTEQ
ncbi:MAG: outer membrane protein assembly factor BamC [Gallionella sp.]|jgi:outer membrane protein assembly factor BamC|nr:outer membrane protein assembly factor BamC [Gallionella sp.]MCK9354762.1 outer membrane protein assembly factor BamC [Gallionella sp.]